MDFNFESGNLSMNGNLFSNIKKNSEENWFILNKSYILKKRLDNIGKSRYYKPYCTEYLYIRIFSSTTFIR